MAKGKSQKGVFVISFVLILFSLMVFLEGVSAQEPYLEASKTASPLNVSPGENITLTINFTGKGDPTSTRKSLDTILSIDTSGSMAGQKIADAKNASKIFVSNMNSSLDQVGLVSFATTATLRNQLTNNFTQINNSINGLSANGYTNMEDGILYSVNELNARGRDATLKFIVLLSDGNANRPNPRPIEYAIDAAQNASANGYTVYTIGLGSDVNETLMRQIATITGGKYYFAPNSSQLAEIFLNISQEFMNIAANNVTLVDNIPENVNFNGPVPDNCNYNEDTRILECFRNALSINESWSISFNISTNSGGSIRTNGACDYSYNEVNGSIEEGNLSSPIVNVENQAPELSQIGDKLVYVNNSLEFNVTATDPNNDNLTYSSQNLPFGSSFSNQLFSWTPSIGHGGLYEDIEFSVSDGLLSDSENITITVCEADNQEQNCVADELRQHFFEWNLEICGENYYQNFSDQLCACQLFEESRFCVRDGYANITYNWNYGYCGSSYSQEEEDMACDANYTCSDWLNIQNQYGGCVDNGVATQEKLCVNQYGENYTEYRNISSEDCNCFASEQERSCMADGYADVSYSWNYIYCGSNYVQEEQDSECSCQYSEWQDTGCFEIGLMQQERTDGSSNEYCTDLTRNVQNLSCECNPQENESQSCGNGGTQIRFCSENYAWSSWGQCEGSQDGGSGGGGSRKCNPQWSCSDWGLCINNLETRTCTDLKKCKDNRTMPELAQLCISENTTSHCIEHWVCVTIGECQPDGIQQLLCTETNKCGTEKNKPVETQSCLYQTPPKRRTGITGAVIGVLENIPWWLVLVALFVVLSLICWGIIRTRKKKKA